MPEERFETVQEDLERERQELRHSLEAYGLSPELEQNAAYGGNRKYDNESEKRYGVNGDLIMDSTQLGHYERSQRIKNIIALLPEGRRELAEKLLELNDQALSYCAEYTNLNFGWGILEEEKAAQDEELQNEISQKNLELDSKMTPYRYYYNMMAILNQQVLTGAAPAAFSMSFLEGQLGDEGIAQINELLRTLNLDVRDVTGLFAQTGRRWNQYQESRIRQMRGDEPAAETNEFSEVRMDVQAYRPELIDSFLLGDVPGKKFTLAEKDFAVQNFDRAFEFIFPEEVRSALADEGKDIFDQIYIDGQSMNEKWEAQYAGERYDYASAQMKCRFMEAALSSARIHVALPGASSVTLLPLNVFSSQESIRPAVEDAVRQRPALSVSDAAEVQAAQERLAERSRQEKEAKSDRIRSEGSLYPDMETVPAEMRVTDKIHVSASDRQREQKIHDLYRLGSLSGQIGAFSGTKEEKTRLINTAVGAFDQMVLNDMRVDPKSHPIYGTMGIRDRTELFFIDGKPAYEYLKQQMSRDLNPTSIDDQNLAKSEIMAAIISGQHRVEMAKVGMDPYGAFQVGVVSVQPDLSELDGQESWYQRKPSSRAQNFYKKDDERQQRISDIQRYMGEKLVTAETRRLRMEEDPYQKAKKRFDLRRWAGTGTKATEAFCGRENVDRVYAIQDKLPTEIKRGADREMGGFRTLAQYLTLAENPQIRFADLMDGRKYTAEKQAAATRLADALEKMYAPKEGQQPDLSPLADIIVSCVRAESKTNLKREILYALNAPEDLSPQETAALMEQHQPETTELLNSMAMGQQFFMQAFNMSSRTNLSSVLYPGADGTELEREVSRQLTPNEKRDYAAVNTFMTTGLKPERLMSRKAGEYLENPNASDSLEELRMEQMLVRRVIAQEGEPRRIPVNFSAMIGKLSPKLGEKETRVFDEMFPHQKANAFQCLYGQGGSKAEMEKMGLEYAGMALRGVREDHSASSASFQDLRGIGERFRQLENSTSIRTLARDASRDSVLRLFMLSEGNVTVDDVLSGRRELRMNASVRFEEALENHPVNPGVGSPDLENNIRFYGQMYAKAAEKLCEVRIPDIDWSDPVQCLTQAVDISTLGRIAVDYSQTMEKLRNKETYGQTFFAAYDPGTGNPAGLTGEQRYEADAKNLCALQQFVLAVEVSKNPEVMTEMRVAAKLTADRVGEIFRGARIGDLDSLVPDREISIFQNAALNVLMSQHPDKKTMEDYLSGNTKEYAIDPKALEEEMKKLASALDKPAQRKQVKLEELQKEEKQSVHPTEKAKTQQVQKAPKKEAEPKQITPKAPGMQK